MLIAVDRRTRRETHCAAETVGKRADVRQHRVLRVRRHRISRIGGGRGPQPDQKAAVATGDSIVPSHASASLLDRSATGFGRRHGAEADALNLDWGLSRQELALLTAANRLKIEFAETLDVATIEQRLHSCYDQLAWRAKVLAFLPLLAERLTRRELQQLVGGQETVTDDSLGLAPFPLAMAVAR